MGNLKEIKVIPHKDEGMAFEIARKATKREHYTYLFMQIAEILWLVGIIIVDIIRESNNQGDFSFPIKIIVYIILMMFVTYLILRNSSCCIKSRFKELEKMLKDDRYKHKEKVLIAGFLEEINTNKFNGLIVSLKLSDKDITQLDKDSKKIYYKDICGDIHSIDLKKKPNKLFKIINDNIEEHCLLNCDTTTMVIAP